ncbi:MAG: thiamine pyrophosphate-binding protein [Acidimicrobiia bacterium]
MDSKNIIQEFIAACCAAGTTHVFGVPGGGSNLDVVGTAQAQGLTFVLTHTESAAAIMAGVAGELTGAPGVCIGTRGPGVASMVNGIAQAMLDRQPVVAVTDNVAAKDATRVSHQRLDQQALMGPITKQSIVLDGSDSAAPARAVALATMPMPGPVHIDIDLSAAEVPPVSMPIVECSGEVERAAASVLVRDAQRPVIIVGLGAVMCAPTERVAIQHAIATLARRTNAPVVCTYKARGVVADATSWCAGVMTGATIESPVLHAADCIIGVGFDPVELIPAPWPYSASIVQATTWPIVDSTYFGDRVAVEVVGPIGETLAAFAGETASQWVEGDGQGFRRQANAELCAVATEDPQGLTPQAVITVARAVAPKGTIATVDAGAHMFAAMQLWEVEAPGELLISSGLATMGFSLPAAIAAAILRPERSVICFTGDGGIGMVLAELETLVRLGLPVVVVVFNDAKLSLIAAKQQPEGHGGGAAVDYYRTDFASIAEGFGMNGETIDNVADYEDALRSALAAKVPALLDVTVDPSAYARILDAVRGPRL